MNRRKFLSGMLAAPLIIQAPVLDYVPRRVLRPNSLTLVEFVKHVEKIGSWEKEILGWCAAPCEHLRDLPMKSVSASEIRMRYESQVWPRSRSTKPYHT